MYTDGGSRGNPGPAGIGVWIETLNKKYSEHIGETTNNVAEYQALIFGLRKLKQLLGKNKIGASGIIILELFPFTDPKFFTETIGSCTLIIQVWHPKKS